MIFPNCLPPWQNRSFLAPPFDLFIFFFVFPFVVCWAKWGSSGWRKYLIFLMNWKKYLFIRWFLVFLMHQTQVYISMSASKPNARKFIPYQMVTISLVQCARFFIGVIHGLFMLYCIYICWTWRQILESGTVVAEISNSVFKKINNNNVSSSVSQTPCLRKVNSLKMICNGYYFFWLYTFSIYIKEWFLVLWKPKAWVTLCNWSWNIRFQKPI